MEHMLHSVYALINGHVIHYTDAGYFFHFDDNTSMIHGEIYL